MTTAGLILIGIVAFLAAILTFFSGFGLGTLLLPVFLLFFPVEIAIAMTGIVHLANNVFKTGLIGRHANLSVVLKFGLPALAGAWAGAWLLGRLTGLAPWAEYTLWGNEWRISPVNLIVAFLMAGFAVLELLPENKQPLFPPSALPFGGVFSGFFGGLSGHQGALRSAFLIRLGLSKETFIASGILIAMGIDIVRLATYGTSGWMDLASREWPALTIGISAAMAGAVIGRYALKKMTLKGIQQFVAVAILVMALALALGLV